MVLAQRRRSAVKTVFAVLAAVLAASSGPIGADQPASAGRGGDDPHRWLAGAIDIHVHSFPDNTERSVDGLEAAIMARTHGMRAIVLKNHYDPTAGLAYMVRKQVAGVEVFGGVDLNLPVGGMNAPIQMTVQQMQDAAALGAFIEFVGGSMRLAAAPATVGRFAEAIRTLGPQFCILSSDLGQKGNPLPADGFAEFIAALQARR